MQKNQTVLIIGYGSAGRQHAKILRRNKNIKKIYIFSKQKIKGFNCLKKIEDTNKINPDYIIISSRTSDHLKYLRFIENNFKNKLILVEKPLFRRSEKLSIKNNKKIFVGYNLRQSPVLNYLKKFIKNKKITSVKIDCFSYLPNWRKNINYAKSNSAKKNYGGGALLELSHEIDYLQWIFGKIVKINSSKLLKLSNLNIDCEDTVNLIGKTKKTNFFINLSLCSFFNKRTILIDGTDFSLIADLINNSITIKQKLKKLKKIKFKKLLTFKIQHELILNHNFKNLCTYKEGVKLTSILDKIKKQK